MTGLDYERFEALTFDCYGTLIDWESGILAGLRPMLARGGIERPDDEILAAYAELEAAAEAGPYRRYRDILRDAQLRAGRSLWVRTPNRRRPRRSPIRSATGRRSPIRAAALARLHQRYRLGVITNCDDDLFARSAERLETTFDWVVTAAVGRELQAGHAQLRGRARADRAPARADPARRPEPLPRPRDGEAPRVRDGLDRPPSGSRRGRGDATRRCRAGRNVP